MFARVVRGVHRKSRRQRITSIKGHTRKHFSRFRFGTSCYSGIEEALYWNTLPEKDKLRTLLENQDYKGLIAGSALRAMKMVNLETITDTQSWYKIQLPNGYNLIRAKTKILRGRKGVHESFSSRRISRKCHLNRHFFGIWQILWRFILESLYIDTPSIRDK